MFHFMYPLLILSPFLLLMSPIYRCERILVIWLGAWVEHPDIYKCILETASPKTIQGNIKAGSIISDGGVVWHNLSCEWLKVWFDCHSMTYFQEQGSCDVAYLIMHNGRKATSFTAQWMFSAEWVYLQVQWEGGFWTEQPYLREYIWMRTCARQTHGHQLAMMWGRWMLPSVERAPLSIGE